MLLIALEIGLAAWFVISFVLGNAIYSSLGNISAIAARLIQMPMPCHLANNISIIRTTKADWQGHSAECSAV